MLKVNIPFTFILPVILKSSLVTFILRLIMRRKSELPVRILMLFHLEMLIGIMLQLYLLKRSLEFSNLTFLKTMILKRNSGLESKRDLMKMILDKLYLLMILEKGYYFYIIIIIIIFIIIILST